MSLSRQQLVEKRALLKRGLRRYFEEENFLEVTTPLLVSNPGLEPTLHYFETKSTKGMQLRSEKTFYLPTSPEYHLKKALSWGLPRVYEITKSFRNGELGPTHNPEFEIIEWYRQPGTYKDIAEDVKKLFSLLWSSFNPQAPTLEFEDFTVKELFQKYVGMDLGAEFEKGDDSFDDQFHVDFMEKVEPNFSKNKITFVWNYPASQRALSKLCPDDERFCSRFEVYWGAVELGNAFDEIIDPQEIRRVCERDRAKRLNRYGVSPELDEEFFVAHEKLKAMGGIAMGIDRILQWLMQSPSMQELMLFSERKFL